jgi:hypothetical protein
MMVRCLSILPHPYIRADPLAGWWYAEKLGGQGWVPSAFVKEEKLPAYTPTARRPVRKSITSRFTHRPSPATLPTDQEAGKQQLVQSYKTLLERAENLLRETTLLRDLTTREDNEPTTGVTAGSSILNALGSFFSGSKKKENPIAARFEKHIPDLVAISSGRISSVVRVQQPGSVRAVAREMQNSPEKAVDIAFEDLEGMARWLNSPANSSSPLDNDGIREALVKRMRSLESALPDSLKFHAPAALMHVEHEVLRRKYIGGDITMLGDNISDIPRVSFLVTEDGYAWVGLSFLSVLLVLKTSPGYGRTSTSFIEQWRYNAKPSQSPDVYHE